MPSISVQVILVCLVFGGVILDVGGTVFNRTANIVTKDLGVNAIGYITPLLALVWLYLLWSIEIRQLDYLILGAIAIVTANLLINFQVEIRAGFKFLLLSLWIGGVFVYLRDDFFDTVGVDRWHWTAGGYFEALALSATVFTLLLAFRVSRLITRTGEEDIRTFQTFRILDMLTQRGVVNRRILGCILRIDAPKDQADLEAAYLEARDYIQRARSRTASFKEVDIQLLSESEANLDALARSKQQDITPGEMFALLIFGAITVSLALLSRPPESAGWNRFLVDIFAILISAVIVFLVVNVWDLRRERDESKLEQRGVKRDYSVRFLNIRQRSFDQ